MFTWIGFLGPRIQPMEMIRQRFGMRRPLKNPLEGKMIGGGKLYGSIKDI